MTEFIVERVHCCVCDGSGKVSRLLFFKRDCNVCDGTGERQILMATNLSPADMVMVRQSAITASPLNYRAPSLMQEIIGNLWR